ncbi:Uncharacterized protein Ga0061063_2181 [Gulbenkiania indica]|uniref:Regulatory protein, RpfE type n=1 Tax=Gulbenkiania indica TaxID=375574 RepID=A0A0K6H191_9NEIS|nr:hypothetical protein [Gulbenkiania indica]CUA84753.1 Uncharacterized protein Ga0061063_2181 [Gulbenkiania indica]
MKLKLVVPGLAWLDAEDGAEVAAKVPVPALSTLLGRGRLVSAPRPLSVMAAGLFGQPGLSLAVHEARRDGLLPDPESHWLVADPVTLRVDRDRALLADVGVMALSQEEADALVASLNRHFAEDGLRFHAPGPGRWYVELPGPTKALFVPLPDAVGEDVNRHLPGGSEGLVWSRFLNELQMLLYTHPVNDAREARGEVPVNSVWLWGEGQLPEVPALSDAVLADDRLWQSLAEIGGTFHAAAPYAFEGLAEAATAAERPLVVVDALQGSAQYRDAWGWREALADVERRWFVPVLAAMKDGIVKQLELSAHGPSGFTLEVKASDLLKFWKRPRPLSVLY